MHEVGAVGRGAARAPGRARRRVTARAEETPAKEAKARKGVSATFERGIAALTQHKAREGRVKAPRAHTETLVVDDQEHAVKLGAFLSNAKSRRAKLTEDKLQQLADLGLERAA
ncbi:Helicase associated domain protein [Streptomyces tubercidicus]